MVYEGGYDQSEIAGGATCASVAIAGILTSIAISIGLLCFLFWVGSVSGQAHDSVAQKVGAHRLGYAD